MGIMLSDNHPFPVDAVVFNNFDHQRVVIPEVTSTGVPYNIIEYIPLNSPGFDYDQLFVYDDHDVSTVTFTVSFDATIEQASTFFQSRNQVDLTGELSNPTLFSQNEITAARIAFAEYEMYLDVEFVEVSGPAEIMFYHDERFGPNGFARNVFDVGWSPEGDYEIGALAGIVALGSTLNRFQIVHELAHILTLKHVGPVQTDSVRPFLPEEFQDNFYSIMFYDVTTPGVGEQGERFTAHLGLFDVYALQQRFGANTTWKAGDTVYTAADFDGRRQVLWDAGGSDTLDFSMHTVEQQIDLRQGQFSIAGEYDSIYGPELFAIAYGVTIENANGGNGADELTGNISDNVLNGNGGFDTLNGGAGNDTLDGGQGDDSLNGGSGADSLDGRKGGDVLRAGDGADFVGGQNGADSLFGENGADLVRGGAGGDRLNGGGGMDTLEGGDGDDFLFGWTNDDTLDGGKGTDTILGGDGGDSLRGRNGDDDLSGNGGGDTLKGDGGNDTLSGGDGDDALFGNFLDDLVEGNKGNDTLTGGKGSDVLRGGADNDRLVGVQGDDSLNGGTGNDTLVGGGGDDTFVFTLGSGVDQINDLQSGPGTADVVQIMGFGSDFNEFSEVIAVATEVGGDVIIDFGTGDTLTLVGRTISQLDPNDFAFG